MSLDDQENYDQPTKRRKKMSSARPFALSQPSAVDTSLNSMKPTKRLSSAQVDPVAAKRSRSQSSQFSVYSGDDEESSKFGNVSIISSLSLIINLYER